MDEYINRTQAIVELRSGFFPQDVVYTEAVSIAEQILRSAPAANVVPKSEVDVWKQNRFNLYQRLECYEMARQKVARQIFGDVKVAIKKEARKLSDIIEGLETREIVDHFKAKFDTVMLLYMVVDVLEKKYTEDPK